jgi:transmembrane sensor
MSAERKHPGEPLPEEPMDTAARWLARRDRGFSRAEQDEYLEWLRADPRHAEAMQRCGEALERMMHLYDWQPVHMAEPDADLFAPPRRRFRRWSVAALAAAAALALILGWQWRAGSRRPAPELAAERSYLQVNERLALPDGSRVELREGCRVEVRFSSTERRVRLHGGEAHFTVWKDPARPFVVEVAGVEVRAVGTAFSVSWRQDDVSVLVTSGTVKVAVGAAAAEAGPAPLVTAGQRAIVPRGEPETAAFRGPRVDAVTTEELGRALAWLEPRLRFEATRLADAVRQFNRLNRQQLVLADAALAELRIGGTFRPDNVEAFVRLLEATFGLQAEKRGANEIVLRRRD